jgi:alkaline phosphatase
MLVSTHRIRAIHAAHALGALATTLALAACSGDDTTEEPGTDAGSADARVTPDGTAPREDGGRDAGDTDARAPADAGSDGAVAPDAGPPGNSCAPDVTTGGKAKNIVFFLGDGMGIPVLTAARIYGVGEEGQLTIDTLPETGFVRTYSKDMMVTDSAPSMSAYMTGVKMSNDVIAMSADTVADQARCVGTSGYKADAGVSANGTPVTTLLELAKQAGTGTGVVTTTRVTHATPAATYAHVCQRDLEADIAAQAVPGGAEYNAALGDGLDVLLGGGRSFFVKEKRADKRDLLAEMGAHGYDVVQTSSAMAAFDAGATPARKLFGVFSDSHMSYEVDRVKVSPAVEPSLAEMATKAVDVLARNPNGYVLMVEGGRIDHALHETHARRALEETLAFDRAIAAVLAKVDLTKTLVVVTADHDHTMIHNGYARRVGKTTPTSAGILGLVKDYDYKGDGGAPLTLDRDGVPYTILGFTNGPNRVSGKRVATGYARIEADAGALPLDESLTSGVDYRQEATFRMAMPDSETHGGTDVSIWATGASSEQVHGFFTNTEVFGLLRCGSGL